MLSLIALVVIVFTKRQWLRTVAWCIWGLGFLYIICKRNVFPVYSRNGYDLGCSLFDTMDY